MSTRTDAAEAMPTERLEAEITSLAGHLAAAMCRWLLLVAEFDRREAWGAWGCRSAAHWLSWQCGLDLRTARDHVRVAHALADLRLIRASFAAGEVSYSKVRAMTRVANVENEAALLNIARHGTTHHLETAVRGYRRCVGAEGLKESERRRAKRFFRWWHDEDGMVRFEGCLPPEDAAVVIAAITASTPPARADGGSAEPLSTRRADALTTLAQQAVDSTPAVQSRVARPVMQVSVQAETLAVGEDGECQIQGSSTIHPETARRLGCDASWVTIIRDPDGNPLYVSDATGAIPRRVRRAVAARDRNRCRVPGCPDSGTHEIHHLRHRIDGGTNGLGNLVLLCRFHHHLVHEGGFGLHVEDGELVFSRPDGTVVNAAPMTPDLSGPGIEDTNRQLGLEIGSGTIRSLWDGFRPRATDLVEAVLPREHLINPN